MDTKQSILIVEDEEDIRELIKFNLENEGFEVFQAMHGEIALTLMQTKKIDLILLDLMMPVMDGLSLCKEVRKKNKFIPILMLTARGDDMDKILGLEYGADDYLVKPFNVRELILRVKSLLKRSTQIVDATNQERSSNSQQNSQHSNQALSIGDITIDSQAHSVLISNEHIETTATEFRLLEDLMKHAGHVRTREQLLNSVWGYEFEGYGRTVDTHIRRLRVKLKHTADYIDTVRGIGYRLKI